MARIAQLVVRMIQRIHPVKRLYASARIAQVEIQACRQIVQSVIASGNRIVLAVTVEQVIIQSEGVAVLDGQVNALTKAESNPNPETGRKAYQLIIQNGSSARCSANSRVGFLGVIHIGFKSILEVLPIIVAKPTAIPCCQEAVRNIG